MAALAMTGLSNIPKKRPKHASGNRNPQQVIEKREKEILADIAQKGGGTAVRCRNDSSLNRTIYGHRCGR
jgi:hypothetical protein